jgi:hypothetical protein
VPDDASNWKMLIVQDGSAHSARALSSTPTATGRAHLAHPRHGSPAPRLTRTSRTRATAHPLSSCLLAIVCSTCGALSGPSTRWFVGDHCRRCRRRSSCCKSQGGLGTSSLAPRSSGSDPRFLALPELEKARTKTAEHQGRVCSQEQFFAGREL